MLDAVLNAIVTDIDNLNLMLGSSAPNVVKRKGVKREPGVDDSLQITVAESEFGDVVKYMAFGKSTIYHRIDITIVAPNNRDWASNLPTYASWRETIRNSYIPPKLQSTTLFQLAGVWDVRIRPNKYLDREAMANLYDEQTITLEVGVTS